MNLPDGGEDNVEYERVNRTILHGNVMNMPFIIIEEKYGAIDANDSACHGYYIIRFSSSTYTLLEDLSIDGQVISLGEMVFKGTYYFPININYHYYVPPKYKCNKK